MKLILISILLSAIRLAFEFYKNPQKTKEFLIDILNLFPLAFVIAGGFTTLVCFVLSYPAYEEGYHKYNESLIHGYGYAFIFIIMGLAGILVTRFFYSEFKKPIAYEAF